MAGATDSLEGRLDSDFAPAWRPKPGEKLIGEVVALSQGTSSYDQRAYPIVTVRRREDGAEFAVHAFETVLLDELQKARPKLGETIGIKYVGEVDGRSARYRKYRVAVERAEGGIDWSAYADEPAEVVRHAQAPLELADDPDIPF